MNESQFMKTMIETIKYDEYDRKDELLTIMGNRMRLVLRTIGEKGLVKPRDCWKAINSTLR